MGNYNFNADLSNAKETEKKAVEKIAKLLDIKSVSFNDDYKYDIKVETEHGFRTYEVKEDLMSAVTKNSAVEFECRGKPSGISTTEADFWIYKFEDGFYQIRTAKLKELIELNLYFKVVSGGDKGSNTKMYLFRLPTLKNKMVKL